jgi:hypothetical protein
MLVGWSAAVRTGEPLQIASESDLHFYDTDSVEGAPQRPVHDLAMTARVVAWLLGAGADFVPPASTPESIAELVSSCVRRGGAGTSGDAWELSERVSKAAYVAFGPPRFVSLSLPSWTPSSGGYPPDPRA